MHYDFLSDARALAESEFDGYIGGNKADLSGSGTAGGRRRACMSTGRRVAITTDYNKRNPRPRVGASSRQSYFRTTREAERATGTGRTYRRLARARGASPCHLIEMDRTVSPEGREVTSDLASRMGVEIPSLSDEWKFSGLTAENVDELFNPSR